MADRIVVLRAGRVEQVGAPLDLYNRPANRFVAGFIGSPQMNFLGGAHRCTSADDGVASRLDRGARHFIGALPIRERRRAPRDARRRRHAARACRPRRGADSALAADRDRRARRAARRRELPLLLAAGRRATNGACRRGRSAFRSGRRVDVALPLAQPARVRRPATASRALTRFADIDASGSLRRFRRRRRTVRFASNSTTAGNAGSTCWPTTGPRAAPAQRRALREPRTWAIAPDGTDVPWEGRDRLDAAGFARPDIRRRAPRRRSDDRDRRTFALRVRLQPFGLRGAARRPIVRSRTARRTRTQWSATQRRLCVITMARVAGATGTSGSATRRDRSTSTGGGCARSRSTRWATTQRLAIRCTSTGHFSSCATRRRMSPTDSSTTRSRRRRSTSAASTTTITASIATPRSRTAISTITCSSARACATSCASSSN